MGNDLRALSHEIDKLVIYKGDEGAIDEKDVALLCPYAAEANIFDLVDAVGKRNAAAAASLLQQKLNDGTDPFYLFTMFVRQFRLLYHPGQRAIQPGVPRPGNGQDPENAQLRRREAVPAGQRLYHATVGTGL